MQEYRVVNLNFMCCCVLLKDESLTTMMPLYYKSRLTGSESQGQEETACAHPPYATTGVLFTGPNAVKFAIAVT